MQAVRLLFTLAILKGAAFADSQETSRLYAFQNVFQPEFRRTTQDLEVYDAPDQVNDKAIESAVRNAINLDDTISDSAKNVLISVENARVTLTGSVRNVDEKRALEFDAQSTLGVKRVYNKVIIVK